MSVDPSAFVHPTAEIEADVHIGAGTKVWHLVHIRTGARIGAGSTLGRNVFVDAHSDEHGTFRQVGWVLAGQDREQPTPQIRDAGITDTTTLLADVGYSDEEIEALIDQGVAA